MLLLVAGLDGILENDGIPIALTGMIIVFSALVLISLALTVLPKALAVLNQYYPEKPDPAALASRPAAGSAEQEVAAAAASAMHLHRSGSG